MVCLCMLISISLFSYTRACVCACVRVCVRVCIPTEYARYQMLQTYVGKCSAISEGTSCRDCSIVRPRSLINDVSLGKA